MERSSEAAARLNHIRTSRGGDRRSQIRHDPYNFQSARVLATMRMARPYTPAEHYNYEFMRDPSLPLQPLNQNLLPSVGDDFEKKPPPSDPYGFKPSPTKEESNPPSAQLKAPQEQEAPFPPPFYPVSRPFYSRQPYYYEEERLCAGYLDDELEGIPPPPPNKISHHSTPLPPTPPPLHSHPRYETCQLPHHYPTPHYRAVPAYSPQLRHAPDDELHRVTPPEPSKPRTVRSPAELQELDIVTGRGAPTNYHYGNQVFRDVVKEYQATYLCAKRSDKPHVAMKILDILRHGGARFVKREKTAGRFAWTEIDSKGAYEKVCQALRDGASDVRRLALATEKKRKKAVHFEETIGKGDREGPN